MDPAPYRRLALAAAAVAVAASATACHGDIKVSGGGSSLGAALAGVSATDVSRAHFEWADLARIRDLASITEQRPIGTNDADHRRWARLFGTGAGQLATASTRLTDTINLFTANSALQIGTPPHVAVRVDGVDTGAARSGLTRRGGKPGTVAGHDGVIIAADNQIDINNPLAELGILNAFNKTAFDGDRVAFGAAEQQVGDALGSNGPPLSADATVIAGAACLGQAITATIAPAGTAKIGGAAQTIAIGVRNPGSRTDAATEELCLTTADKAGADTLEQQVRQHATTSALSATTRAPWSTLFTAITVSRPGDRTVRVEVTDRPDHPAGLLLQVLQQQDLASLVG